MSEVDGVLGESLLTFYERLEGDTEADHDRMLWEEALS